MSRRRASLRGTFCWARHVHSAKCRQWLPHKGFWPGLQCQMWISFCERGFKSNQRVMDGHHKISTVIPLGACCVPGWQCSMHSPQLSNTVDESSLQQRAQHILPLQRLASRKEASSSVLALTSLGSVARERGIFRNRALVSSSHGQPTVVAIACLVLGVLEASRANMEGSPCPALGFSFHNLWLLAF